MHSAEIILVPYLEVGAVGAPVSAFRGCGVGTRRSTVPRRRRLLTRYGAICHSSQPPCSSRIRLPFASTCSPDAAAALQLKPGLQRPSSCEAAIWGGRSRARGGAGIGVWG